MAKSKYGDDKLVYEFTYHGNGAETCRVVREKSRVEILRSKLKSVARGLPRVRTK